LMPAAAGERCADANIFASARNTVRVCRGSVSSLAICGIGSWRLTSVRNLTQGAFASAADAEYKLADAFTDAWHAFLWMRPRCPRLRMPPQTQASARQCADVSVNPSVCVHGNVLIRTFLLHCLHIQCRCPSWAAGRASGL